MFYELIDSEKIAVVSSENATYTYSELKELVNSIGDKIPTRSLVFCLCHNCPASLAGYLACLNKKAVPLLLDRRINEELLTSLINAYQPGYIYCPKEMEAEFAEYEVEDTILDYMLLRRKEYVAISLFEDLALLLTTSGSTGSPKLVRQSYTNIQSNAEAIVEYLEITNEERPITTLPMNYTYGLSIINSHLQAGATILMTDLPMNTKAFWDFFKNMKATSFGGVPFTYEMLKKVHFFNMELPDLRYMTQAGGKLSPELHLEYAKWCEQRSKKFVVMYGQTEATARMAYLPYEYSADKYGSVGRAIPGGELLLKDVNNEIITTPETVGEMVYRGPNVTLGYAETAADLSKKDERHGVLETGDMAKFDKDGFFYIVGRKKRFLKIFGNRVNLDEVDQLLKRNFEDMEAASSGVDDHMTIFVTNESAVSEVKKWIAATTHLSETAFSVKYIEAIPKNEAGKVIYKNLPL